MHTKQHAIRVSTRTCLTAAAFLAATRFTAPAHAQEIVEGLENAYRYAPTDYESKLRNANMQGRVAAEVLVDADGFPIEARIVDGPLNQLRRHVLRSVMDWRWAPPGNPSPRVRVVIDFKLGSAAPPTALRLFKPGPRGQGLAKDQKRSGVLNAIDLSELRPRLKEDLTSKLPVKVGQRLTREEWPAVQKAVKDVDEWLDLRLETAKRSGGTMQLTLRIFYPVYLPHGQSVPPPPPPPPPPALGK